MGIPVKLNTDGFMHLGEEFKEGEIFNAPHECFASFMCDQEKIAERVDESELTPEKVGTMKRTMKRGNYDTKVMKPEDGSSGEPIKTKGEPDNGEPAKSKGAPAKKPARSKVKATSNEPVENT